MKHVFNWALGFVVYYFIIFLFAGVMLFDSWNNFDGRFINAVLFGFVVAAIPAILSFFKIKESNGALLLGGLVINFFFYFLGYYVLNLFTLAERGTATFFHSSLEVNLDDKVISLILISLFSSAIIVGLQALSKKS